MDMYASYLSMDALQPGLNDLYARAHRDTFRERLHWKLPIAGSACHMPISLQQPLKKPAHLSAGKQRLGSEFDLMLVYKPVPNLEFNAAYCLYFKTATREFSTTLQQVQKNRAVWIYYDHIQTEFLYL